MINKIISVFGWMLLISTLPISVYIRFSHPELTETQLFVEFWRVWVTCVVFSCVGFGILNRDQLK